MYLPKFKYKPPKFSPGVHFSLPNGKPYVGWYFETYKQEFYSGKEPGPDNKKLTPLQVPSHLEIPANIFTPTIIRPTPADIQKGFFTRYFVQDRRNKKIVEVKKDKYDQYKTIDYLDRLEIKWVTKKPAEDTLMFDYKVEGAATKNKQTIQDIESKFPGIKNLIKSYAEFVQ